MDFVSFCVCFFCVFVVVFLWVFLRMLLRQQQQLLLVFLRGQKGVWTAYHRGGARGGRRCRRGARGRRRPQRRRAQRMRCRRRRRVRRAGQGAPPTHGPRVHTLPPQLRAVVPRRGHAPLLRAPGGPRRPQALPRARVRGPPCTAAPSRGARARPLRRRPRVPPGTVSLLVPVLLVPLLQYVMQHQQLMLL